MRILELEKITAGGRHGWYKTNYGFNVRKPLGYTDYDIEPLVKAIQEQKIKKEEEDKISLWKMLWNTFRSWFT